MPATHFVSTVLPAPLSPHRAVTWPDGRSRATWYRAWTGPKCLSRPRICSSTSPAAGAAAASVISIELSRLVAPYARAVGGGGGRRRAVRRRLHGYEMLFAWQTACPTALQSSAVLTKLSLRTVSFMFALLTQIGVRRTAGCWLPETPDGGAGGPLTSAAGAVAGARGTVARATAACASR